MEGAIVEEAKRRLINGHSQKSIADVDRKSVV